MNSIERQYIAYAFLGVVGLCFVAAAVVGAMHAWWLRAL